MIIMDRITAFLSYSSAQKQICGKLKSLLIDYCGYKVFIAHEDIQGSRVWEDEIISNIVSSDFFIPLLSKDFRESNFADQEIGIAVCLKKKIIPIKLDATNPYGFIQKYQAIQLRGNFNTTTNTDNLDKLVSTIAQIGLSYEFQSLYYQRALNSIIYAFSNSGSYKSSNTIIQILCECNYFTAQNLKDITKAVELNPQIRGAFGLANLRKCFFQKFNTIID